MKKLVPEEYLAYLRSRTASLFTGDEEQRLRLRGFWVGSFLSFFLAVGAPYANMVIKGSYVALDMSAPGALFLFLLLIGLLNTAFKLAGRGLWPALAFAAVVSAGWVYAYWPCHELNFHSPGTLFSTFLLICALANVPAVSSGRGLALSRSELVLVYAMLMISSALCTVGLGEQILPMVTAIFYYASPTNKWREKLFPHFPDKPILVDDGTDNRLFYEGTGPGGDIPYEAWIEPLVWWGVFLMALYVSMVCVAVILRRQWMERERLPYPMTQVGLAMMRGEEEDRLVNGFFAQRAMWLGCALPMVAGSMKALSRYNPAVPYPTLSWSLPFVGRQTLSLDISFLMLGFSYLINANVAAGIWFFHLLSKVQKEVLILTGITSEQKLQYGVSDFPLMAYQGVGALLTMVVLGLWVARGHLRVVFRRAIGRGTEADDADEILSYRSAVFGLVGSVLTMTAWLTLMGTPAHMAFIFLVVALLLFIGVTRVVAEAGLVGVRAPMIAPDLVVQGMGSALLGPTGVFNLALTYIWAAEVRVFVMATCTNSLKLLEEMEPRQRRLVFGAIILAIFIGSMGSFWGIFHTAYDYGGINLNGWFFKNAPAVAYQFAERNLEPLGPDWTGWGFFSGGGLVMALMMWARHRFVWWPVHPIGFPIGANSLMNRLWFSVFVAWLIKRLVLRYGGAAAYNRGRTFFLGMIVGHILCVGSWLVIDYFTGKVGNAIFKI